MYKTVFLLLIPLSLSSFTHLWNPTGFPLFHIDEGYYMERTMDVLKGNGALNYINTLGYYDHPYFGQLFLAGALRLFDFPNSMGSLENSHSTEMAYSIPRILMGILAVIDTFLIYKICEYRYNRTIGFFASVIFATTPITWLLRSIWLDNILLPFLLSSILFAVYAKNKLHNLCVTENNNIKYAKKRNDTKIIALVVISGAFLGLAIFTKETAFTMIPLVGYLIFANNRSLKLVGVWFIPVTLIPAIWPISAVSIDQFDKWLEVIEHQTHRVSKPLVDSIIALFIADPVLSVLAFTGLLFAGIKKDAFLLLWATPFLLFEYVINFVSLFHFILIMPFFCISTAVLILDLSNRISKKSIRKTVASSFNANSAKMDYHRISIFFRSFSLTQNMLGIIILSGVALFGLASTSMLISLNLNSAYFQATDFISNYLPGKEEITENKDNKVTVLSRAADYSWIPKYVSGKDQHDYEHYSWKRPIRDGNYLLVVDDGFRNIMAKNDELSEKLNLIYNKTTTRANFQRSSEYFSLHGYPYSSIDDRQVLNSLGIASGTKTGKIEIKTNYGYHLTYAINMTISQRGTIR